MIYTSKVAVSNFEIGVTFVKYLCIISKETNEEHLVQCNIYRFGVCNDIIY